MSKTRKYPAADEKALILKRYLVEKVPMSDLCDEYNLQPSQIYGWQKQLFENAPAAFRRTNRRAEDAKDRNNGLRNAGHRRLLNVGSTVGTGVCYMLWPVAINVQHRFVVGCQLSAISHQSENPQELLLLGTESSLLKADRPVGCCRFIQMSHISGIRDRVESDHGRQHSADGQ